jgi:hypothetical protein
MSYLLSPAEVVRALIHAENERDAVTADRHLAVDFVGITRSAGHEQSREELLASISNPENPTLLRNLEVNQEWGEMGGGVAVVRSVVTTEQRQDPGQITGWFRNVHVLLRAGGEWKCVHWQATRLTAES